MKPCCRQPGGVWGFLHSFLAHMFTCHKSKSSNQNVRGHLSSPNPSFSSRGNADGALWMRASLQGKNPKLGELAVLYQTVSNPAFCLRGGHFLNSGGCKSSTENSLGKEGPESGPWVRWIETVRICPTYANLDIGTVKKRGYQGFKKKKRRRRRRNLGLPGGSAGKESSCDTGDLGSIPGLGRSPGEGNSYPL